MAESSCTVGDLGWISGLGRSPGGGNGNPLQSSCLGNPVDRGAWQVTVHGVAELDTTEPLSTAQKGLSFMAFGEHIPAFQLGIYLEVEFLSYTV